MRVLPEWLSSLDADAREVAAALAVGGPLDATHVLTHKAAVMSVYHDELARQTAFHCPHLAALLVKVWSTMCTVTDAALRMLTNSRTEARVFKARLQEVISTLTPQMSALQDERASLRDQLHDAREEYAKLLTRHSHLQKHAASLEDSAKLARARLSGFTTLMNTGTIANPADAATITTFLESRPTLRGVIEMAAEAGAAHNSVELATAVRAELDNIDEERKTQQAIVLRMAALYRNALTVLAFGAASAATEEGGGESSGRPGGLTTGRRHAISLAVQTDLSYPPTHDMMRSSELEEAAEVASGADTSAGKREQGAVWMEDPRPGMPRRKRRMVADIPFEMRTHMSTFTFDRPVCPVSASLMPRLFLQLMTGKAAYDRYTLSAHGVRFTLGQYIVDSWNNKYGLAQLTDRRAAELVLSVRAHSKTDLCARVTDLLLGTEKTRFDGRPICGQGFADFLVAVLDDIQRLRSQMQKRQAQLMRGAGGTAEGNESIWVLPRSLVRTVLRSRFRFAPATTRRRALSQIDALPPAANSAGIADAVDLLPVLRLAMLIFTEEMLQWQRRIQQVWDKWASAGDAVTSTIMHKAVRDSSAITINAPVVPVAQARRDVGGRARRRPNASNAITSLLEGMERTDAIGPWEAMAVVRLPSISALALTDAFNALPPGKLDDIAGESASPEETTLLGDAAAESWSPKNANVLALSARSGALSRPASLASLETARARTPFQRMRSWSDLTAAVPRDVIHIQRPASYAVERANQRLSVFDLLLPSPALMTSATVTQSLEFANSRRREAGRGGRSLSSAGAESPRRTNSTGRAASDAVTASVVSPAEESAARPPSARQKPMLPRAASFSTISAGRATSDAVSVNSAPPAEESAARPSSARQRPMLARATSFSTLSTGRAASDTVSASRPPSAEERESRPTSARQKPMLARAASFATLPAPAIQAAPISTATLPASPLQHNRSSPDVLVLRQSETGRRTTETLPAVASSHPRRFNGEVAAPVIARAETIASTVPQRPVPLARSWPVETFLAGVVHQPTRVAVHPSDTTFVDVDALYDDEGGLAAELLTSAGTWGAQAAVLSPVPSTAMTWHTLRVMDMALRPTGAAPAALGVNAQQSIFSPGRQTALQSPGSAISSPQRSRRQSVTSASSAASFKDGGRPSGRADFMQPAETYAQKLAREDTGVKRVSDMDAVLYRAHSFDPAFTKLAERVLAPAQHVERSRQVLGLSQCVQALKEAEPWLAAGEITRMFEHARWRLEEAAWHVKCAGWRKAIHKPSSTEYWFNRRTGETSWREPPLSAVHRESVTALDFTSFQEMCFRHALLRFAVEGTSESDILRDAVCEIQRAWKRRQARRRQGALASAMSAQRVEASVAAAADTHSLDHDVPSASKGLGRAHQASTLQAAATSKPGAASGIPITCAPKPRRASAGVSGLVAPSAAVGAGEVAHTLPVTERGSAAALEPETVLLRRPATIDAWDGRAMVVDDSSALSSMRSPRAQHNYLHAVRPRAATRWMMRRHGYGHGVSPDSRLPSDLHSISRHVIPFSSLPPSLGGSGAATPFRLRHAERGHTYVDRARTPLRTVGTASGASTPGGFRGRSLRLGTGRDHAESVDFAPSTTWTLPNLGGSPRRQLSISGLGLRAVAGGPVSDTVVGAASDVAHREGASLPFRSPAGAAAARAGGAFSEPRPTLQLDQDDSSVASENHAALSATARESGSGDASAAGRGDIKSTESSWKASSVSVDEAAGGSTPPG